MARDDGGTALMFAAMEGHLAVVDKLLEANATIDLAAASGATAVKLAAQSGHQLIAKRLIAAGASGTKGAGKAVDVNELFNN
mmetsp:Transcript_62809/g.161652  ORF Transcript_62809/g.161652 Transcript_62809/m.161652 type:complete len:82 (+) Transcript_62809:3-248(+)